jgi:hypothetical protein
MLSWVIYIVVLGGLLGVAIWYKSTKDEERREEQRIAEEKRAEQEKINRAEAEKARRIAEEQEIARRRSQPFLYTSDGTPCYLPCMVRCKNPLSGVDKFSDEYDYREYALDEFSERIEKGWPIVELYAYASDRRTLVMWARAQNGIITYDIRE